MKNHPASLVLLVLLIVNLTGIYPAYASPYQVRQVLQHGTVMGFRHYEGKQFWEQLRLGQSLTLIREPDNPHDSQAIRIEWYGHKLGYVPRADNSDLARLMDNGAVIEARIVKLEKSRRPNNRVRFEVYLPAGGSRNGSLNPAPGESRWPMRVGTKAVPTLRAPVQG